MKNRLYFVCGALLVAAVVGLLWWSPWTQPEPIYGGKPVSYWCYWCGLDNPGAQPPGSLIEDTNAVAFLIRSLRQDRWVGAAIYRKQLWPILPPFIKIRLPHPINDPGSRIGAANILSTMGPTAKSAVPALVRTLRGDDDVSVRLEALFALTRVGKGDGFVLTVVLEAMGDKERVVRKYAAYALALIGEGDESAVVALTRALKDTDRDVRLAAVDALDRTGKGSSASAAALTAALVDEDIYVRMAAVRALLRADPEAAAKAGISVLTLVRWLADATALVRITAINGLGQVGEGDESAVAALVGALKDTDGNVRRAAVDALGSIGKGGSIADETTVIAMTGALLDRELAVRQTATNALLKLGPEAAAGTGVKPPSP
jgi:HEAT repeat protein